MELEFESRTTEFLRLAVEGSCRQELTTEAIVPDSEPDAARVVYCCAQMLVRSKECCAGSILISGGVQARALYVSEGEEEQPHVMEAWLPFTLRLDHPEAGEDTQALLDCRVCTADARLVHSRKLLFRAEVGAQVFGFAPDAAVLPLLKQTPPELQLRCRIYPLCLPAETAEKSFLLSDELELPPGQPAISALIGASAAPEPGEQRLVGSKAVFKGNVRLKLVYLTEDGSVHSFTQSLPYSQYCQLTGDYDDDALLVLPAVTGCEVELQSPPDAARLLYSVHLLAQCLVTQTVTLTFCEDAFSTCGTLCPEWREYSFGCLLDRQLLRQTLRDAVRCEGLRGVADTEVWPGLPTMERTEQGLRVTVPVAARVLGFDADGALRGAAGSFQSVTELPAAAETTCLAFPGQSPEAYASAGADGAEVRAELPLELACCTQMELRTLSSGTIDAPDGEQSRRPAVILRRTVGPARLWDVAKEYGTSVASICAANALEADEVEAGTLLLIPV